MPWFVEVLKGKYKGVRGVIDHESKYYYYIDVNNPITDKNTHQQPTQIRNYKIVACNRTITF